MKCVVCGSDRINEYTPANDTARCREHTYYAPTAAWRIGLPEHRVRLLNALLRRGEDMLDRSCPADPDLSAFCRWDGNRCVNCGQMIMMFGAEVKRKLTDSSSV